MNKELKLKSRENNFVDARLKILDTKYIDKIMELQKVIIDGLDDKQLYAASKPEEFIECIEKNGTILGVITDTDELVAMGVYMKNGYDDHNYGYDIGLRDEDLLRVGQIESTVVRNEFRGNRLQKIICEALEEIGISNNTPIMCSTASPYNEFSVNTFKTLGYEIKADKMKYGGLRRYVFYKELV